MNDRRRLAAGMLVAALAHAALYAAVRPRGPSTTAASPREPDAIDVVVLAPFEPPTFVPSAPSAPAVVIGRAAPSDRRAHGIATTAKPAPDLAAPPSPSGSESTTIAQAPSATPKPAMPSLIGEPGKHDLILPGAPSKPLTQEEAIAKNLDASLKAGVDAHDALTGGGFGGPVSTAAHAAAMGFDAPQTGWATFDVETDAKGVVTSVRLAGFGADPVRWEKVGKELRADLASQRLRVPTGANGVHVRVKIEASLRLPSGAKKHFEAKGLGGEFDLSDLGQSPKRVVAVMVIEERRL